MAWKGGVFFLIFWRTISLANERVLLFLAIPAPCFLTSLTSGVIILYATQRQHFFAPERQNLGYGCTIYPNQLGIEGIHSMTPRRSLGRSALPHLPKYRNAARQVRYKKCGGRLQSLHCSYSSRGLHSTPSGPFIVLLFHYGSLLDHPPIVERSNHREHYRKCSSYQLASTRRPATLSAGAIGPASARLRERDATKHRRVDSWD